MNTTYIEYTCAACGEECVSTWSDEEAQEDRERNYPGWDDEDMVLLCEDCYDDLRAKQRARQGVYYGKLRMKNLGEQGDPK